MNIEITGMVFALTEVIKMAGLPSRFLPLVSIALGVGLAIASGQSWFVGIVYGLTASGLYAGAKAVTK